LPEDIKALTYLSTLLVEQVERFRADELQRLAREAELRALQAQVNPHFLFNALNTLYGTIDRESTEARRLVLNLAELFRYCLQHHQALIPLADELEIVQAYLEIESMRLQNRLTFKITAAESIRDTRIPVLSIQPLVENAIKHGISRLRTNGRVQVTAWESKGTLQLKVQDNGPGLDVNAATSGLGMGLDNVRQRLLLCYGQSADLQIESSREGYSVTISIPLDGRAGVRLPASHVHSRLNASHLSTASTHL
jgi:two-component system sensor histidine kinase LytS